MSDPIDPADPKATLHRYLRTVREAVLWKLDGLPEYDVRRPLTGTGTNLLGLVKHLSIVEATYLGATFDRPFPEPLSWWDDDAEANVDLWATEDESRAEIVDRYRRAAGHADATIEALDLDATGRVPWWGPGAAVTLHTMLVHVLTEANRHAGHADILREQLDGAAGHRREHSNLAVMEGEDWTDHLTRVERAARLADPVGAERSASG